MSEVEDAFRNYLRLGNVEEDWPAWAALFTDDALYIEHVFGTMHGRDAIKAWIVPTMAANPAVYGVYIWHMVDGDRIAFYLQNRRDHPDPSLGAIEFPSLSILEYAGDGKFSAEEDFYSAREVVRTTEVYREACRGRQPDVFTRRHWAGPDWARGYAEAPERTKQAVRDMAEGRLGLPPLHPLTRPSPHQAERITEGERDVLRAMRFGSLLR
jgi:hypothetical protein